VAEAMVLTGGVRWQFRPEGLGADGPARLFGPDGLRLAEWLACGAARVVKQGPHRTVYQVALPGLDFHLKHYPIVGRRAWLRGLVRPSKARAEYDLTAAVAGRGVPTFEPLAVGEAQDRRDSFLLTRTLGGAVPLNDFLDAPPPDWDAGLRQALARALADLLARMHDAGVRHDDLHPGNILLRRGGGGELRLYLIDLHAVRLGPPLDWRSARDNLVVLNRYFALRAGRSDRLRFWQAYRAARRQEAPPGRTPPDPHRAGCVVRDLEWRTLHSNLAFWRGSDRRCLGGNRHYRSLRSANGAGHAVADLDPATLAALLRDPDAVFRSRAAQVLKDSPTSTVVEFDLPGPAGVRRVVCKRFAVIGRLDPLTALVRSTPALRSYVLGHALRLRCLPTPRPLAVWQRRRRGLPREGYLLAEKVPDALDLRAFVDCLGQLPRAERLPRLRRLIDQLARLVGLLHHRHLSHRDLKAANLLVSPAPCVVTGRGIAPMAGAVPGTDQVWFIDLVGVRRHGKLRRRRRLQNLARLNASFLSHPGLTRTDRLRFLRVYLRWGLRGRLGWKRWWRQLEEATQAKVRRNVRNGRPLA
jgi:tRNA A-37 threonylcarbamoyl transferase component Bud32